MFKRLLPRSAPYFDFFEKQNAILQEMAALLLKVVDSDQNAEAHLKRMNALEIEADDIQYTIINELSQTFITPIDREDIYAISMAQERVIDSLNQLGTRFFLFSFVHVRFPARKMLENMRLISIEIQTILQCLRLKKDPGDSVRKIHGLKENCSMLMGVGLSELQDAEVTSFDMIKQLLVWSQLYDRTEESVLLFSEFTDTLEQAVLKYA